MKFVMGSVFEDLSPREQLSTMVIVTEVFSIESYIKIYQQDFWTIRKSEQHEAWDHRNNIILERSSNVLLYRNTLPTLFSFGCMRTVMRTFESHFCCVPRTQLCCTLIFHPFAMGTNGCLLWKSRSPVKSSLLKRNTSVQLFPRVHRIGARNIKKKKQNSV